MEFLLNRFRNLTVLLVVDPGATGAARLSGEKQSGRSPDPRVVGDRGYADREGSGGGSPEHDRSCRRLLRPNQRSRAEPPLDRGTRQAEDGKPLPQDRNSRRRIVRRRFRRSSPELPRARSRRESSALARARTHELFSSIRALARVSCGEWLSLRPMGSLARCSLVSDGFAGSADHGSRVLPPA